MAWMGIFDNHKVKSSKVVSVVLRGVTNDNNFPRKRDDLSIFKTQPSPFYEETLYMTKAHVTACIQETPSLCNDCLHHPH